MPESKPSSAAILADTIDWLKRNRVSRSSLISIDAVIRHLEGTPHANPADNPDH